MDTGDSFSLDDLQTNLHQALRAWKTVGGTPDDLLASLWIVQEKRKRLGDAGSAPLLRAVTNEVLETALVELENYDAQGAEVLQKRFIDGASRAEVAGIINLSEDSVSRIQSRAVQVMAEIILEQEKKARADRIRVMKAALPPSTYTRLFDLKEAQDQLQEYLAAPDSPWIVTVVGIGGIGKTALVDSVVRRLIDQFVYEQVVWIRIKAQTMHGRFHSPESTLDHVLTALNRRFWPETADAIPPDKRLLRARRALQETATLVIIDNLEDGGDADHLLAHLHDLTQPSKFLLTSRNRAAHQAPVFHFPVSPLSLAAAGALMRHHAAELGITVLAESDGEDIAAVYDVAGGNPLALKLIVSLLDVLPLSQVLAEMERGRTEKIEDMYRHIYWQTWRVLSEEARLLLQAMPLMAEVGGTSDYIKSAARLDDAAFWPAVQELRNRSLLEVRGSLEEKRYGIHRLTETFLRTEIINWPDDADDAAEIQ